MFRRGAAVSLLALALAAPAQAADPLRSQQWGLDMVEAGAAHATSTGQGAVVAVIDTGVQRSHPDLAGRLLGGYDFVDNDGEPQDGNGHGTHVTGIVAAATGNGVGVESVAPAAKVLPVRVLADDGSGYSDDVAEGIDYAVSQGAHVINLSLSDFVPLAGGGGPMDQALDRALDRGVVVAAAAGNSGVPFCENPSGQGRLLCVGAVDRRGSRSFYSSFGEGLGLMGPGGSGVLPVQGEDILSTYPPNGYAEVAGTSQATPHVAAVAALLAARGITGQDAVRRILASARDAGPAGPDSEYGAGIVNARAAVEGSSGGADGGGSADDLFASARVSVRGRQRIRTVLRRGIVVRCRAAGAGACRVSARASRRRIARGSRRVPAGRTRTVRGRLTRRGKALLRRALRRRVRVRVALTVTLPGASVQRRLTLVP